MRALQNYPMNQVAYRYKFTDFKVLKSHLRHNMWLKAIQQRFYSVEAAISKANEGSWDNVSL